MVSEHSIWLREQLCALFRSFRAGWASKQRIDRSACYRSVRRFRTLQFLQLPEQLLEEIQYPTGLLWSGSSTIELKGENKIDLRVMGFSDRNQKTNRIFDVPTGFCKRRHYWQKFWSSSVRCRTGASHGCENNVRIAVPSFPGKSTSLFCKCGWNGLTCVH